MSASSSSVATMFAIPPLPSPAAAGRHTRLVRESRDEAQARRGFKTKVMSLVVDSEGLPSVSHDLHDD